MKDSTRKSSRTASVALTSSMNESAYNHNGTIMDDSTYHYDFSTTESEGRDEVKEVQKLTSKDTAKVRAWRLATTFALLLTALAVTLTTYMYLKAEEKDNFEKAFDQFSRAIADAAIAQQVDLREGLASLATVLSLWAESNNATWPYVTVPKFEYYAQDVRRQTQTEFISYFHRVEESQKETWTQYANQHANQWVEEGHEIQMGSLVRLLDPSGNATYNPYIHKIDFSTGKMGFVEATNQSEYLPLWQFSPPPATYAFVNFDGLSQPHLREMREAQEILRDEALCTLVRPYISVPLTITEEEHKAYHSKLENSSHLNPHTFLSYPVHKDVGDVNSKIVAYLAAGQAWDVALLNLLPSKVNGLYAVVRNSCNQSFTYEIRGPDPIYLGEGDLHQSTYDDMEVFVDLALHTNPLFMTTPGHCRYSMSVYPSDTFQATYDSNTPEIFAAVVAATFGVVALVFFTYDTFVQRRNTNLTYTAAQSNSVLTSVFPEHMRSRLHENAQPRGSTTLKSYLNNNDNLDKSRHAKAMAKPLADLFLETTILFADISGFTAWSSVREPSQVFSLLESTYQVFDHMAKRHRVFKVETVGDCYVAVAGLPEAREDHAVAMAFFAKSILGKMHKHMKAMEKKLGPDTENLTLRIGLHSGPVTAGVLRGERARFQLFGDTYHVCAKIESSGKPGRIHCSKETAELLTASGKGGWLEKRPEGVTVNGKGTLETYWVTVARERTESLASGADEELVAAASYGPHFPGLDEKTHRLIDWNVEMLLGIMRQMVAHRGFNQRNFITSHHTYLNTGTSLPLEEVREIIALPAFDAKSSRVQTNPVDVKIPGNVIQQLHHLVSKIASMYNDNPFHNFYHASNVVMSVTKLMSRIVAPSHLREEMADDSSNVAASLHDHSFGITSDPLTQFACAFSALIHDVDHSGVSNAQLVKEGVPIAERYKGRSVAEQNSLDLSWNLLMQDRYEDLRAFLFPKKRDLTRFRQLVVNSVMSTDIVDKDMKALRNARWDKAFKKGDVIVEESSRDEVNRKATIVIEHIIQASDISHTMQHWHIYRKWNQNLFEELYVAYLNGRMEKNPVEFWYKGEFGFFDFYIIPLTQKLKDCGVFGVSSDELLHHAKKNREEWEMRGEEVVALMIKECYKKYGMKMEDRPEQALPPLAPPGVTCVVEC